MNPDFDWHSEDDLWLDGDVDNHQQGTGTKLSKLWLAALIFLAAILVALVVFRQLQDYVAETASLTENEVEQSLNFLLDAQESGDLDLFASFISGRDTKWAEDQLLLMESGRLIDRAQFGLKLLPQSGSVESTVTVAPDLNEAVLERAFSYKVKGAISDLDTVDLMQLFVFRMGRDRWLLSPPDRSFWGGEEREVGRFITVVFPERDGEWGRRLASDLEGTVSAVCSFATSFCIENLHVTIQFTNNPEALYQNERPDRDLLDGKLIVWPTLSLFGRPADEAGYRAIYRLFSESLVRELLEQQARYTCCIKPEFHAAFTDILLNQMGFVGFESQSVGSQNLDQIAALWLRDAEAETLSARETLEIKAFVNGIAQELSLEEINDIQEKSTQIEDFWVWLEEINEQLPLGN